MLPGLASTSGTLTDVCGTGSQISGTTVLSFTGGTLSPGETRYEDLYEKSEDDVEVEPADLDADEATHEASGADTDHESDDAPHGGGGPLRS